MESYIVRIYQRDKELNIFAGIVEAVESQERKSFKTREELAAILDTVEARKSKILWDREKERGMEKRVP